MFTHWITKARYKIWTDGYYERRLRKIADELDFWNHFRKFECSEFFRGELKAELNRERHDKAVRRLKRKAEWYKKKIEEQS